MRAVGRILGALLVVFMGFVAFPAVAVSLTSPPDTIVVQQASPDAEPVLVDPGAIIVGDNPSDTTPDLFLSIPTATWLVSTLIPALVALIAQSTWSTSVKGWLNLGCSVAVAAISTYIDTGGSLPLNDLLRAIIGVAVTSQVAYALVWRGSTIQQALLRVGSTNGS